MGNKIQKSNSKADKKFDDEIFINFNLDFIVNELETKTHIQQIDLRQIEKEFKKLNASKIAYVNYSLKNANEFLSNITCSTCLTRLQQYKLVKVILTLNYSSLSLDDLYLCCMESSCIDTTQLIFEKLITFGIKDNINKCIYDSYAGAEFSRMHHLTPRYDWTILDAFLSKFKTLVELTNHGFFHFGQDILNYHMLIKKMILNGSVLACENESSLDLTFELLIFIHFDLNNLILHKHNSYKIIKLFNESLKSIIIKLNELNMSSNIFKIKSFEIVRSKMTNFDILKSNLKLNFFNQIIHSPSFKYISKANKKLVFKLVDLKKLKRKPWPMRLDHLSRIKIKEMSNCTNQLDLPDKLIEFLDYKNESINIFIYYFI
jgi:hypothetical protein